MKNKQNFLYEIKKRREHLTNLSNRSFQYLC